MNTLFLVALIVEALFSLGFLFVPGPVLSPLGVTLDDTAMVFARLFGSALISFPFLLWFARKSSSLEYKLGVLYSLFAYYLLASVILVVAELEGKMNTMGWGVIAIHVALTVWFGYFVVKQFLPRTAGPGKAALHAK